MDHERSKKDLKSSTDSFKHTRGHPSNWDKVKHAFLTPSHQRSPSEGAQFLHGSHHDNSEFKKKELEEAGSEVSYGGSLPPSPNSKTTFTFEGEVLII